MIAGLSEKLCVGQDGHWLVGRPTPSSPRPVPLLAPGPGALPVLPSHHNPCSPRQQDRAGRGAGPKAPAQPTPSIFCTSARRGPQPCRAGRAAIPDALIQSTPPQPIISPRPLIGYPLYPRSLQ